MTSEEMCEQPSARVFVVGAVTFVNDIVKPNSDLDTIAGVTFWFIWPVVEFLQTIADVFDVVVFALWGSVQSGDGFPRLRGLINADAFGKCVPATFERWKYGFGKVQMGVVLAACCDCDDL